MTGVRSPDSVCPAHMEMVTPAGPLRLTAMPAGLIGARFNPPSPAPSEPAMTGAEAVCAARHLDRAASELERYFAGDSTAFDIDVDLGPLDGFARAVLEATRRIIFGRVATYSEIAAFAGDPRAARSVGGILGANPLCVIVPCHRVVPRGGGLGGYVAGVAIKEQLLRLEGVRLL